MSIFVYICVSQFKKFASPLRRENYKLRRTTEMTTLAEDIKALMDLGHGLERATELAVADRKRTSQPPPAPGNYLHPVNFIESFPSHILHICILFAFDEVHLVG